LPSVPLFECARRGTSVLKCGDPFILGEKPTYPENSPTGNQKKKPCRIKEVLELRTAEKPTDRAQPRARGHSTHYNGRQREREDHH